jgi:shikimate dehydrogenase
LIRPSRLVLIGSPVAQSLSPRLQNAALASAGLPLRYEALDVAPAELDARLREFVRDRVAGNVTIPHKQAVAERCAELTPLARRVGAVNTFWPSTGGLTGDNTDVPAFAAVAATLLGREPRDLGIALLGAGGAAAAVCAAAGEWPGARVRIFARGQARAEALARRFSPNVEAVASVDAALQGAGLVVNATPLGRGEGDEVPAPAERLPPGAAVLDLNYRRGGTAWAHLVGDAGFHAADGLGMLVEQGALAFERWFGLKADREAMWSAVR